MIGQKWYYVEAVRPTEPNGAPDYVMKSATIEGETPRMWILRQDDAESWIRGRVALGEAPADWSIPKKGEDQREGKSRYKEGNTRAFFASEAMARTEIQRRIDERWAYSVSYKIAQKIQYCRDAAILKKVAELVGWKEET